MRTLVSVTAAASALPGEEAERDKRCPICSGVSSALMTERLPPSIGYFRDAYVGHTIFKWLRD